jgi:cell division septum initiation protein DivIVA
MKQLLLIFLCVTAATGFAQNTDVQPLKTQEEQNAEFQKKSAEYKSQQEEMRKAEEAHVAAASKMKPAVEQPAQAIPCTTCKPISKSEDRELISELMLELQKAQADALVAKVQAEEKVRQFMAPYLQRQQVAFDAYLKELGRLQESHNAKGCELTFKKTWINCQPEKSK